MFSTYVNVLRCSYICSSHSEPFAYEMQLHERNVNANMWVLFYEILNVVFFVDMVAQA